MNRVYLHSSFFLCVLVLTNFNFHIIFVEFMNWGILLSWRRTSGTYEKFIYEESIGKINHVHSKSQLHVAKVKLDIILNALLMYSSRSSERILYLTLYSA